MLFYMIDCPRYSIKTVVFEPLSFQEMYTKAFFRLCFVHTQLLPRHSKKKLSSNSSSLFTHRDSKTVCRISRVLVDRHSPNAYFIPTYYILSTWPVLYSSFQLTHVVLFAVSLFRRTGHSILRCFFYYNWIVCYFPEIFYYLK